MRHSTLRQIAMEADTRGRAFSAGSAAQTAVHEVALVSLRLALAESDQPRAWERVALTLANQGARLPIDALGGADQARWRLALLAELPEITGFSSFQDVADLIGDTINVGAPRYNSGDIRGCAALYWMIIRLICETPATRGFSGYARLQGNLRPLAEAEAHAGTMSQTEADAWAWELRHALDATARVATP